MRHLIRLAAAAALLLLLAAPALAQGRVIIDDPGGRLDETAVQRAARPLVSRGASVAVYMVDSGGQDDFVERLVDDGLARADGALLSNVIAIYVAFSPTNYSSIAFGDQWSDALAVNDNYDVIRQGDLNPGLSDQDYTRGVTTALAAIEAAIANPPIPGGGTVNNIDFMPVLYTLGGLAAAGAGGAVLVGRRRTAKARADAQQRLKDAREGAGAVIADLGRRFNEAGEKAKFDKVSYAPDDVARVQQLQQQATARFVKVQEQFDDVGEQLERYEKPTNEQLAQAAAGYDQVKGEAQGVVEAISAVAALRAKLDEQARAAREELDRAKKL